MQRHDEDKEESGITMNKLLLIGLVISCALGIGNWCKEPKVVTVPEVHTEYKTEWKHDTLYVDKIVEVHDTIRETKETMISPSSTYCFGNSRANLVETWLADEVDEETGHPMTQMKWSGWNTDKMEWYCDGTYTKENDFHKCSGYWYIKIKEIY